jgi:hypothetical protein
LVVLRMLKLVKPCPIRCVDDSLIERLIEFTLPDSKVQAS